MKNWVVSAAADRPATIEAPRRQPFYFALAVAMSGTAFLGFWFTYFGPLFAGAYPRVSPLVHVHGWSFFAWYLLLPLQAGLIRSGRVAAHRFVGLSSIALGLVMVVVGLIISTVQVDLARRPDGNPFWRLMGLPIFSIWVLFTVFYVSAILRRKHRIIHKQFIVLASATALAAATFRILVQVFGFATWVAIAGCLTPIAYVLPAAYHEYRARRSISSAYLWGIVAMAVIISGAFAVAIAPSAGFAEQGVGWLGAVVSRLYLRP